MMMSQQMQEEEMKFEMQKYRERESKNIVNHINEVLAEENKSLHQEVIELKKQIDKLQTLVQRKEKQTSRRNQLLEGGAMCGIDEYVCNKSHCMYCVKKNKKD